MAKLLSAAAKAEGGKSMEELKRELLAEVAFACAFECSKKRSFSAICVRNVNTATKSLNFLPAHEHTQTELLLQFVSKSLGTWDCDP